MPIFDWEMSPGFTPAICLCRNFVYIWVRSRNCGCLVTWFCSHLIAKPGNKTAAVSWPDPYQLWRTGETNPLGKTSKKLFWIVIPTFGKSYHKDLDCTASKTKARLDPQTNFPRWWPSDLHVDAEREAGFPPGEGSSSMLGDIGCAAVLAPIFDILGIEHDPFGVLFLIHRHQNNLLGNLNYQSLQKSISLAPNFIFTLIFLCPIFSGQWRTPIVFWTKYPGSHRSLFHCISWKSLTFKHRSFTLVSWIVEHIEISEHLAKFAEELLVEHLFYTISIATNKRTPGTFLSLRK